jgi:DNA-binding XRE family transcriptional regulator
MPNPCPLTRTVLARYALTHAALAQVLDVSVQTVSAWSGGHRTPLGPAHKLLALVADGTLTLDTVAQAARRVNNDQPGE